MKNLWTVESAAKDLDLSMRQMRRWLEVLDIQPTRIGSRQKILLGPPHMERLRKAVDSGSLRDYKEN